MSAVWGVEWRLPITLQKSAFDTKPTSIENPICVAPMRSS